MSKIFGTDGIRGFVGKDECVSADYALKIGQAYGLFLKQKHSVKPLVIIGKDTRASNYMFEGALQAGLCSVGVDVYLLGPLPTSAVSYFTLAFRASAGIMISASHNPYHDNGIKFFDDNGAKISQSDEQLLCKLLQSDLSTVYADDIGKAKRIASVSDRYIEFCKSKLDRHLSLKGLKILLDCANGASYQVAPKVFSELGAQLHTVNNAPNGFNINRDCGSTHISTLCDDVIASQFDCGIAVDGDGDRLCMVDEQGEVLDGDDLLYIVSKHYKQQQLLTGGVVGTVMSNLGLEESLAQQAIPFERVDVGDRNIMQALYAKRWHLGGEPSGHFIDLSKSTSGDGVIAALLVLSIMVKTGESLSALRQSLQKIPQYLVNVPIKDKIDLSDEKYQTALSVVRHELGQPARVNVRPSGTQPLIRIMVESPDEHKAKKGADYLAELIAQDTV